ncbi:pentapeptide repeat-containing protein [Streptomyces sp. NPDC058232]|uniref:pentapeptide repeat-containing protein n=1 Tax=Streptomyces sp. NPDC058232 TaxID=3346393 RepID=UPI0036E06E84
MSLAPAPAPPPPPWQDCGHGADPAIDFPGCSGALVSGHTACLAHLDRTDREAYLTGLAPGADINHRGTPFTESLLYALLDALYDPVTGKAHFGIADFRGAQFSEDAGFDEARFSGNARFDKVRFLGHAVFSEVQFSGEATFCDAQFSLDAVFVGAKFLGTARFDGAQISGDAWFNEAQISGTAWFNRAHFSGKAEFNDTQFSGTASFHLVQFSGTAGFNSARFSSNAKFNAQFSGVSSFGKAEFSGDASFGGARFSGDAMFDKAQFSRSADFFRVQFSGDTSFGGARFSGEARFSRAHFSAIAWFGHARFSKTARFTGAQFSATTRFDDAQFSGPALFLETQFALMQRFGPVVCAKVVDLSGAVFEVPVTLEIAARKVLFERTRWESTATLRLRHATVDLSHAVLSNPVAITAHPAPFTTGANAVVVQESLLQGSQTGVRMASVRGVDAAHLVLTDIVLVDCLFTGAFHLDQLRLEGRCTFASTPTGLHRRHLIWPHRWSRRRTLAEEHHWRAQTASQPALTPGQHASPRNWRTGPHHPDPGLTPDPEDVATLYRQLRKAFEDGKNEPGAADFYYGEMEMRRHDRTDTPPGERALLWGYWLLSGYGLRASRALGWLLAAVAVTLVLMMGLGLPDSSPEQAATGTVPAGGGKVKLVVEKHDPRLTLPVGDRFTGERFDKSVQVVLNSVVFRASGQDLTTWGTYTEMVSRFTEPVLLALAALAMRSRIKR